MDKYHIYEEIGKGEFSQVFKGREKKKIEYVAIKRVEKDQMNKVVNEVQVMHKLDSPHTLKFHDWYETRNNLWLILEYCTGSDLQSLLCQDGHLPEQSVRSFGLDMLAGLKYMHGLGLLHCDLRPSNFLVDEYGILKLCDFKFARRVPKAPLGPLDGPACKTPLEHRGTPPYLAPELWRAEGLHSFATDFWALGCVLYELRRGQEPFGGAEVPHSELRRTIESLEPVRSPLAPFKEVKPAQADGRNNPGSNGDDHKNQKGRIPDRLPSMSAELGDVLGWLLEKQPQARPDWKTVSTHPFWGRRSNAIPQSLPDQDAYNTMVRLYERTAEKELQEDIVRECHLSPRQAQEVVDGVPPATPQGLVRHGGPGSATKTPQHNGLHPHVSDSTPIRPQEKPVHSQKSRHGAGVGVGVTIGEEKLTQAEGKEYEYEEYSSPSSNRDRAGGSTMHDRGADSKSAPSSQLSTPLASNQRAVQQQQQYHEIGDTHAARSEHRVTTPNADRAHSHLSNAAEQQQHGSFFSEREGAAGAEREGTVQQAQVTPGILGDMTPATGAGGSASSQGAALWPLEQAAEALLLHTSDTQVKPIVANKNIEPVEKFTVRGQLPFHSLSLSDIQELSAEGLEKHLTAVYKSIQRINAEATSVAQKSGAAACTGYCTDRIDILSYLHSLGSVAEVANIVLNTNFLALLLKLLRADPPRESSAARNGSRGASRGTERDREMTQHKGTVVTPAMTNLRTMAATVLATMLRYATYVSPPSAKGKDDHLLPVLTSILKTEHPVSSSSGYGNNNKDTVATSRLDAKLKRRVIAALGETLFYMSSQGDAADDHGAVDGAWPLPPGTMTSLVRCLKDESDEAVRHYAAKTIENIMAQGSTAFKRRLVSVDVATRLLELSQQGRNDAFQASCGMALSHIFTFVMASEPAEEPPSPARGGGGIRGARNLSKSPSSLATDASGLTPGAGARFIVKVIDRGGLPAILETLQDGQPRLQQAYLNIVNLIFAQPAEVKAAAERQAALAEGSLPPSPIASQKSSNRQALSGSSAPAGAADLKSVRQFFLRGSTLVPTVLQLIEQGGSSSVRAKALLLAQLLCLHRPSLLVQFSERRLPSALMRLVEPLVVAATGNNALRSSRQGGLTSKTDNNGIPKGGAAYPMHAAVSFVSALRAACTDSTTELAKQCKRLATASHTGGSSRPSTPASARGTGGTRSGPGSASSTGSGGKRRPGSPATAMASPSSSSKATRGSPSLAAGNSTPNLALKVDLSAIHAHAEVLRAGVTAAALPSLRRLILADGPSLVLSTAVALQQLSAARKAITVLATAQAVTAHTPTHSVFSSAWVADALAALAAADQALLVCLEGIAAVDAADLVVGIGHHVQTTAANADVLEAFALDSGGGAGSGNAADGSGSYAEALVTLLPAMSQLCVHPDGDVRVVLSSCLRRLLPGTLRALQLSVTTDAELLHSQMHRSVRAVCGGAVTALLKDQAPIPQYAVRMLSEAMQVCTTSSRLVVELASSEQCLPALVKLYSRSTHAEEWEQEYDPQLTVLLRAMFEQCKDTAPLLQAGLASCTVSVLHCRVYNEQMSTGRGEGLSREHRIDYLAAASPVLELLYVVLYSALRKLSKGENGAVSVRGLVEGSRGACHSLLGLMMTALVDLAPSVAGRLSAMQQQTVQSTGDTASRCLGILFDLYPDAVSMFLCQDSLDGLHGEVSSLPVPLYSSSSGGQALECLPRDCLAVVMCHPEIPLRMRNRMLKVLAGAVNLAGQLGTSHAVQLLLTTAPVHSALEKCARDGPHDGSPEGGSMAALARQVSAAAASL